MTKAAKSPVRPICPLFPGHDPPIFVDDIDEIAVYRTVKERGKEDRSRVVDFEDDYFVTDDGEPFEIDRFECTDKKLTKVLRSDKRLRGETGVYLVVAIGGQREIAVRRLTVTIDSGQEPEEEVEQDEEEDGDTDLTKEILRENMRNAREARKAPMEMFQLFAAMNSQKRDPDEVVKTLQEELRTTRARGDDEIRRVQAQRDADVARLQDDLRLERQRAEDREKALRDENRDIRKRSDDDIRTVREKAERELDAYRKEASEKIFELQKTVLSLQTDSQKELLKKSEELMQERMKAALATREVEDAKMALESAEETMEEQLKGAAAAAAGEELPPWAKMMMPFAKPLIEKLMASGQPLPQNPQEVQQLVDRIQIPPVQPSYMPPGQYAPSPLSQEPAVRMQQPRMPEPEESDESDDESEDEGDESDQDENAAE